MLLSHLQRLGQSFSLFVPLRTLLLPSLFFFPLLLSAQEEGESSSGFVTLHGYIREQGSTESLPGAHVRLLDSYSGTSANIYGFYTLRVPRGPVQVCFSHVGYTPDTLRFNATADTLLNVELLGRVDIDEVRIEGWLDKQGSRSTSTSTVLLPVKSVTQVPMLLGERDVMKVLQLMPGIQGGQEGTSGIYIRGGGPDQNMLYLDGTPLFYNSHFLGLFSIFNGDAIKSIEVIKGGFPARYGGRLSSVIDIVMDDGDMNAYHGKVAIGNITANTYIEGPIVKEKASFIVSGRLSYITALATLLASSMQGDDGQRLGVYFYDLTAKFTYRVNPKHTLYLSGYFGRDLFNLTYIEGGYNRRMYKQKGGINWGNGVVALRWNWIPRQDFFSNLSVHYSHFQFKNFIDNSGSEFSLRSDFRSIIQSVGMRWNLEYAVHPWHTLQVGVESSGNEYVPQSIAFHQSVQGETFERDVAHRVYTLNASAYIEDEMRLWNFGRANLGARTTYYGVKGLQSFSIEGRAAITFYLTKDLSLKTSVAQMLQPIHLLTSNGLGLPTDLWVPATARLKPEKSWITTLGFTYDIHPIQSTLSLEGFYKQSKGVIHYREGASFFDTYRIFEDNFYWEKLVNVGRSWAAGFEFLLQRKVGRLTGWAAYTLSFAQMQFDSINAGRPFWARYDRRHDVALFASFEISKSWHISAAWVFTTGTPFTLRLGEMRGVLTTQPQALEHQDSFPIVSDYNALRMEPNHRLDIGVQWTRKARWVNHTLSFDLYNAYAHTNPFFYFTETRNDDIRLRKISFLRCIPSLSYSLTF